MEVSIIRGIKLQVFIKDSVKGISETEGDGWVSLQPHPLVETIKVHPSYRRIFRLIIGFGLHNRGDHRHFLGSQPLGTCEFKVIRGPEIIVSRFLLVQDFFH